MTKRALSVLMVVALMGGLVATSSIDANAAKRKKKKCRAYKPGELGAEAETIKVTNKATAEAPVEVVLTLDPGAGQATGVGQIDAVSTAAQSHAFYNVQVDPRTKTTGLYMSLASPMPDDNDLYLFHATGTEAAHAAGFHGGGPDNLPTPVQAFPVYNSNANGGHTGADAEYLDGILTKDCGGYTVHAIGANSRGGDVSLKLWLGEPSEYEVPAP